MDPQILAFFFVAAVLTITPGADTLLVFKNTLRGGRRDGWSTTAGICSGLFVHATFSALGLSIILAQSAVAFQAVKWVGAGYLIWIGLQTIRDRNGFDANWQSAPATPAAATRSFREGFLSNVLNPKVALFYLAFLPQFISPGDPVLAKSLLLASIHLLQGVIWLGGLSVLIARSRVWVDRPAIRRWLNRVSGGLLVALGLRLAAEGR